MVRIIGKPVGKVRDPAGAITLKSIENAAERAPRCIAFTASSQSCAKDDLGWIDAAICDVLQVRNP